MSKTRISYATDVVNFIGGCTPCSPGCDHCYAATVASTRLKDNPLYKGLTKDGRWTGEIRLTDKPIVMPGGKPKEIFVNSMSDLFHPKIGFAFIDNVYRAMRCQAQHKYLLLTKRPKRLHEYCETKQRGTWPENIYLGLTICNQKEADEKLPIFLKIPGKKWLSIEPCLGFIDLDAHLPMLRSTPIYGNKVERLTESGLVELGAISQVIVGGESGPNARPMHQDDAAHLRSACFMRDIPFYFKQWGGKRKDRLLDGVLHDELIWRLDK